MFSRFGSSPLPRTVLLFSFFCDFIIILESMIFIYVKVLKNFMGILMDTVLNQNVSINFYKLWIHKVYFSNQTIKLFSIVIIFFHRFLLFSWLSSCICGDLRVDIINRISFFFKKLIGMQVLLMFISCF